MLFYEEEEYVSLQPVKVSLQPVKVSLQPVKVSLQPVKVLCTKKNIPRVENRKFQGGIQVHFSTILKFWNVFL
jgi:hypothetical protein